MLLTSPLVSQTVEQVADGVFMLDAPARGDIPARNIGWVEFDDYVLFVDGWPAGDAATSVTPARYIAYTLGSGVDSGETTTRVTGLAPIATANSAVAGNLLTFQSHLRLEDGDRRVDIRRVGSRASGYASIVHVPDAGVLFAGDLVGRGRGSEPLPVDDWIRALRQLERLTPRIVIPGRGPVEDAGVLEATRMTLVGLRGEIAAGLEQGRSREEIIAATSALNTASLPDGTAEHVFDELVGIRPATAFVEGLGLREAPDRSDAAEGWVKPRKVVVSDFWPGRTEQLAYVAPGVEVVVVANARTAAAEASDADAVLGMLTPEILSNARQLRWVQLASAGVERWLAIPGFTESDIVLSNAQRLFAPGGAEHVIGMTLMLSRRLHTALELQQARRWDITPLTGPNPYVGEGSELLELRGRTMLVVGLGGIGTEVARLASGLGMRVVATRGSRREGPDFVDYVGLSSEFLTLAAEADVIVNSVPLTSETEGMFDDAFFGVTKPTAFLINIGRGRTVDTDALTRALEAGRIAGAGLDVTDPEPLPPDHQLWDMPNVIITPHIGGDSNEHMERIWLLFRENLRRFVAGEALLSVVDKARGY